MTTCLNRRFDVAFREDPLRVRKDNTAENCTVVRHTVPDVLKPMDDERFVVGRCCYDGDLQKAVLFDDA